MNNKLKGFAIWASLIAMFCVPLAGQSPKREPSNPADMEINRAFKEQVKTFGGDENNTNGIVEPMLSKIMGKTMHMPHTKQIVNGELANLLVDEPADAIGAVSATGHVIKSTKSPQRDLFSASLRLSNSARAGIVDSAAAEEMLDILLGRTEGKIYDGFPLLNFNRFNSEDVPSGAFSKGSVPGEYKMKQLRFTGEQEPSWKEDGTLVNIWEIDVNHLWYDQQFDSDTFLIKVPYEDPETGIKPDQNDVLRINYTIYSLVEEDFAPTQVTLDAQVGLDFESGSVRFPYKGQDTVWRRVLPNTVHKMTVQHTAIRFIRGIYIWGWNVHPPRIQFLQPILEVKYNSTGEINYEPQGLSFATRNRNLSIDDIGDAAPEKKLYNVAKWALEGMLTAEEIDGYMNDSAQGPRGTWQEWIQTMTDQRFLPPEARDILASEGKTVDDYDFVTVYMNNEMYGAGPLSHTIRPWSQGEHMHVRLMNLDNHTHYFRNVGFGAPLHNDYAEYREDGIFSFEIMNFKPLYGAPKVAEMQWRAGWGFRPHYSVVQQLDVFPRKSDERRLEPYLAPNLETNTMEIYWGYQYSKDFRGGDFPFNPPPFIIHDVFNPAHETLYDLSFFKLRFWSSALLNNVAYRWDRWKETSPDSYKPGLVIGQTTEGYGTANMCPDMPPGFCGDIAQYHWRGIKNWPAPNDPSVPKTELRFPPFLRNPDQVQGGDIIPPTWTWKPFLWINPNNGTIYMDPEDESKGYWADQTYSHGAPIFAGEDKVITIEMPRAAAQLFYQFDDLFHDNAIFSPHPIQ